MNTKNLTGYDILNAAHNEISAIAASCYVDWDRLHPKIHSGQAFYKNKIATEKRYEGKVSVAVHFNRLDDGREVPIIQFRTFKHGGVSETFNGFEWLKTQSTPNYTHTSAPRRKKNERLAMED